MSIIKNIFLFLLGAPIGGFIALYLALVSNHQKLFPRTAFMIEAPFESLFKGFTGPKGDEYIFLFHVFFWCVLAGLLTLSAGILITKLYKTIISSNEKIDRTGEPPVRSS